MIGLAGMIGSSPPVRGALCVMSAMAPSAGLIPARAGSTTDTSAEAKAVGAHPRPCGEHEITSVSKLHQAGSSPPVRGAR